MRVNTIHISQLIAVRLNRTRKNLVNILRPPFDPFDASIHFAFFFYSADGLHASTVKLEMIGSDSEMSQNVANIDENYVAEDDNSAAHAEQLHIGVSGGSLIETNDEEPGI